MGNIPATGAVRTSQLRKSYIILKPKALSRFSCLGTIAHQHAGRFVPDISRPKWTAQSLQCSIEVARSGYQRLKR